MTIDLRAMLTTIDAHDRQVRAWESMVDAFGVRDDVPELRTVRADIDAVRAAIVDAIGVLAWAPSTVH